MQEIVDPLGHVGEGRLLGDQRAGGHGVVGRAAHADRAVREQGPVRALAAVRHADAARVDDLAPVGQPGERHVGVPADHRHHLVGQFGEDLGPPLKPGVDDDHLLVVARGGVAEDDRAEIVDLERDRVGQAGQPVHVVGGKLARGPRRNGVANVVDHAAGQVHEFPVRVAAHPGDAVAEAEQPVERLRSAGVRRRCRR